MRLLQCHFFRNRFRSERRPTIEVQKLSKSLQQQDLSLLYGGSAAGFRLHIC